MPMKLDLAQKGALSVDLHQFGKDKELESIDEETGDVELELELTLYIGCYQRKKRLQSSSPMKTGTKEKYSEPSSSITNSSATFNQDYTQSNRVLQDLRVNKT
ncbi:hypothetical protein Adt_33866 [Abeliophyllum distichum]|uniref:Uncharacterized protein n=1 Tax=Abeliophyllum distichum TaxID=126358 RepID=A0ABD1QXH4_9LAMI